MGCVVTALWECFEDAGWTEEEFDRASPAEAKRNAPSGEPKWGHLHGDYRERRAAVRGCRPGAGVGTVCHIVSGIVHRRAEFRSDCRPVAAVVDPANFLA